MSELLRAGLLALLLASVLAPSMALAQEEDEDAFVYDEEEEDDFFVYDEEEDELEEVYDPLESFNRRMFTLNDMLYRNVFKPVAVAYRVVPRPVRRSVANFLDNLGRPVSAINALLQLDLYNTGTELARFGVNSTLGVLGLFDPATNMNLVPDDEDLGQTLGRYGVGHGFYLVIPGLGPTTLRGVIGRSGNVAMDPFIGNLETGEAIGVALLDAETALSLDEDTYEAFYDRALDPYLFFRSAYIQNRDGAVDR